MKQNITRCVKCQKLLQGKQRKYCSKTCKGKQHQNNSYDKQQIRGQKRKDKLIALSGGKCIKCGYNKCTAAMSFHHINPQLKSFSLDYRHLSNTTMSKIMNEFSKCELLCLNCHAEHHFTENRASRI